MFKTIKRDTLLHFILVYNTSFYDEKIKNVKENLYSFLWYKNGNYDP